MVWIDWPTVYTDVLAIADRFDLLLGLAVMRPAQGLQGTEIEQFPVSSMRNDVVADSGYLDPAL
jgi:hypothetical protein